MIFSHGRFSSAQSKKPEAKAQQTSSRSDVSGLSSKVLNVPNKGINDFIFVEPDSKFICLM